MEHAESTVWADGVEARERELLLAGWCQVRPVCHATRWLDLLREVALTSPDGAVHMWTERSSLREDHAVLRGYVLEYSAPRPGPSSNKNEQFTVYQWESNKKGTFGAIVSLSANTKIVTGNPPERWTVARFLAKPSYEPRWHLWFRASHGLALIPGRLRHQHEKDARPQVEV